MLDARYGNRQPRSAKPCTLMEDQSMIETSAGTAVVRAISAQVAARRNSPAICAPSRTVTYQELENQANRLACYLSSLGIGTDVLVGLCMPRSLEMMLG